MELLPGPVAGDEEEDVVVLLREDDGAAEVEAVAGDSVVVTFGAAVPLPVEGVLIESAAGEVVPAPRAALRRVRYAIRTISISTRVPQPNQKVIEVRSSNTGHSFIIQFISGKHVTR